MAILVAWKRRWSGLNSTHGTGRLVFPRSKRRQRVGEVVRRAEVPFHGRKGMVHQAHGDHALVALVLDFVPTRDVAVAVLRDVLRQGLQREMGRREADVVEKRAVRVTLGVFLQALDGVVGDVGGEVETGTSLHRRQGLVVQQVVFRAEVPVVILDAVGVVEAGRQSGPIHVPFAGVITAVSGWAKQFGQQGRPRGAMSPGTAADAWQFVPPYLLGIITGENDRAGRPTAGGVVELGEPQAVAGQLVQVGRLDLPAIAAEIGVAQIVGEDEQDVGTPPGQRRAGFTRRQGPAQDAQGGREPQPRLKGGLRFHRFRSSVGPASGAFSGNRRRINMRHSMA